MLGLAQRAGALVVNDPQGLRDMNEKLTALEFPQCCPPTLVSRDAAALKAFIAEHGEAVLKTARRHGRALDLPRPRTATPTST